jgi:hypothetical protein
MIIKDFDDALFLVTRVVTTVLGRDVGKDPDEIDTDLTFTGAWPDEGYGRDHIRYLNLCTEIAEGIRTGSDRDFNYQVSPFVLDHETLPIAQFIVDSATQLLNSPVA